MRLRNGERLKPIGAPLIDIAELARLLATSPRHVRRLVEEHRVPYLKIGHYVRWSTQSTSKVWLEQQRGSDGDRESGQRRDHHGSVWPKVSTAKDLNGIECTEVPAQARILLPAIACATQTI